MENERFEYSPIISRKPFKLPLEARLAVWVVINIEYFDIGSSEFAFAGDPGLKIIPDVRNYATRDYGSRIGVWRIMEVLDRHEIRATVALNSGVCDHYPVIIEEGKKRKWEFMGHGISNSMLLAGLSEDEERRVIGSSLDTIAKAVGQRPVGWLSPGLTETFNTPDILAEAGIKYLCDWCNDDQPYPMKVKKGNFISIPYSREINDIPIFISHHLTASQFTEIVSDQFDCLYREGAGQARIMAIALHPFVIGTPFRIASLDRALRYIKSHQNVWFATGWEIARYYYENYLGIT